MNSENHLIQTSVTGRPPRRFDEDGFLLEAENWNQKAAEDLAKKEGIGPLTNGHWRVIEYVRDGYLSYGSLPLMRLVCRGTGMSRYEIVELFGNCRNLWRVAGLPNPGEEFRNYMF